MILRLVALAALLPGALLAGDEKPEGRPTPPPPVETQHEIQLDGKPLRYSVTTGLMPIKDPDGVSEAHVFFMAYVVEREAGPETRPLTFSFNGGPGSSSVWLHLGALGPRRTKMLPDGSMPPPPYEMVDNEGTWLGFTDIVFIDPVGTGFSRTASPDVGDKFWGLEGDIESVGEFIRLYLTRYERWASPLFMVGESYGTTRAAGLAGHLIERGIAFNGITLVSSILNFQTARFVKGNDLPYVLFLPTYAATAWYHQQLDAERQGDLRAALDEVESFAEGEYALALAQGSALPTEERAAVIAKLARFTGLSESYIDNANLRIVIHRFTKELLRHQKRTVGRLDSRFKGIDLDASRERTDFDPSMTAIRPPFTATFNHYVRTELGYETDEVYYILGGGFRGWDMPEGRFPDTSESLREALSKNPAMRVFIASGYYDLATPYFATEYTMRHLGLDPEQRGRIETGYYEAGHMMYIDEQELRELRSDVEAFYSRAVGSR